MYHTIRRQVSSLLVVLLGLLFSGSLSYGQVNFEIASISATAGATVDVPITVSNFTDVAGISAQLQFPSDQATFISIVDANNALTNFTVDSYHDLGTGQVNILWVEPSLINTSIADGSLLFHIRVQIDGNDGFELNLANLVVSDAAANQISATSSSGRVTLDPLTLSLPSLTTNTGATLDIPVTVANFQEVVGFQFGINFPAAQADFLSIDNIHPSLTGFGTSSYFSPSDGKVNILWDEASLTPISLSDDEVLFMIKLEIEAIAPDVVNLSLTDLSFYDDQVESIAATAVDGELTVLDLILVSGIVYREDGTPIGLTEVTLIGSHGDESVTTTADGSFLFSDLAIDDYELLATKEINPVNGVDVADILLIRRHLLGIVPLGSPYQLIAADADFSDQLDVADILAIRSLVLGSQTTLANSWRFIDDSYVFNDPSNPFNEAFASSIFIDQTTTTDQFDQNFIGVKVGDVNNNSDANQRTMGDDLFLAIANEKVFEDDLVRIPVWSVENYEDIAGWQGTLNFDPSILQYEGIEAANITLNTSHIGFTQLHEGQLSLLYDSPTGLGQEIADNSPLFYLIFRSVGKAGDISEIDFNSTLIPSKVYDGDLASNFELSVETGSVEILGTAISVYPNPGRDLKVSFVLPSTETVTLEVVDILGKRVYYAQESYPQGGQIINLDANKLPAGTYILKFHTGNQTHTEKLIIE